MKIADLPNCPQWLKDAKTDNADVAFCSCGCEQIVWHGGVWLDGEWHGGVWLDGEWQGGEWLDGVWRGGEWHGGVWLDGEWQGGVWRGGVSTCRSKYIPIIKSDKMIQIGCKTHSREWWDTWFDGSEVFETPRDTEAFRLIEGHYRTLVVWAEYAGLLPRKEGKV